MTDRGMILLVIGGLTLLAGLFTLLRGKDHGSTDFEVPLLGIKFSGPVLFGVIVVGALMSYFGATMQPPRDVKVSDVKETKSSVETDDGWVYLGQMEDGKWKERLFSGTKVPKPGDVVTVTNPVNIRSGPIEYSPITGWTNKQKIGTAIPGTQLTVKEVKEVDDGFYWLRVQR
jgi:hypothetical protein